MLKYLSLTDSVAFAKVDKLKMVVVSFILGNGCPDELKVQSASIFSIVMTDEDGSCCGSEGSVVGGGGYPGAL